RQAGPHGRAILATVAFLPEIDLNLARRYPAQRLQVRLQIIRMRNVHEGLFQQFLAAVTEHAAQPLVDFQKTAIRCDSGDTKSGVVEDNPEPVFARVQRLFGSLLRGDVASSQHGEDLFSPLVADRFSADTK